MIAAYAPLVAPPSAQPPTPNLAPRDVERLADDLVAYHARFAPLFQRSEQRRAALLYLQGQLLDLERKTIEPLAHAVVGGDVQALQQFIGQSPWDAEAVLHAHQAYVGETLGDADEGAFIIDGCDFPKQGTESVGVARQWCGPLGKRANCQAGVVVCYASPRGYTLVDRRLYLPEQWFAPAYAARRRRCGVPAEVTFRTRPELAGEMVAGLRARGPLPARWALCDEGFGRDTALLDRLAADLWYLAEVPHTTRVWTERPTVGVPAGTGQGRPRTRVRVDAGAPAPVEVAALAAALPPTAWRRHVLNEGAKGPLVAAVACVRAVAVRDALPGPDVWVVLRRGRGPDAALKAFLSNAPADLSEDTLAQRTAARWPVERGIEECKGEVGLDQYEVRGWVGWQHHVTLSFLAHHVLVQARLRLGKKARRDRAPGARLASGRVAAAHAHPAAGPVLAARHPASEPRRVPLPSQARLAPPPRHLLTT